MAYKKAELYRLGFSEDGATAYCDVRLEPQAQAGADQHGAIDVKVYVPVKPTDTIQTLRDLATDAAVQMLRTASR